MLVGFDEADAEGRVREMERRMGLMTLGVKIIFDVLMGFSLNKL